MTELILNQLNGTYYPAYFEIFINIGEDIDLNALPLDKQATFFHEWIHFIQDFTTGIGCHNAYTMIETLKYVALQVKGTNIPFQIPVAIGNEHNVKANGWVRNKAWGTTPKDKNFNAIIGCKNIIIPVPADLVSNATLEEIPSCQVTTDAGETFIFGTKAIMESMAFECQAVMYPSTAPNHAVFPYHTARKVADYMVHGFTDDPLRLIALCDMSLMSSAPGVQFSSFLMDILNKNIPMPNTPEEIYDYFYKTSILIGYEAINQMTEKSYLGIYKDPVAFQNLRQWISNTYHCALELRKNNKYFILDVLRGGAIQSNCAFQDLLSTIGSPLLRNNKDYYWKIPSKSSPNQNPDIEYIIPLASMVSLLTAGSTDFSSKCPRSCRLIKWCINSDKEATKNGQQENQKLHVDTNCCKNPSLRIDTTKYSSLCPFAVLYYASGLSPFK